MSKPHILTVHVDPTCEHCASENPDDWCGLDTMTRTPIRCISWDVACPGLTEDCRVWWECIDCNRDNDKRDALDEDSVQHGVEHRQFYSCGWATPGTTCVYLTGAVADAIGDMGPEVGAYRMDVDWGDDLPDVGLTPLQASVSG